MKINKKALLLGTMAFVLVAASGMVSAYASGSSGTKKAKVQTITEGVCIGSVDVGGMTKEEAKKAVDAYVDSIKDTSFSLKGANSSFDTTAQEMSVSADTDAAADEALSVCHEGSLIDRFVESEELKKGNVAVNMYLSVDKQKTAKMIYDKSDELNIKAVDNSLQRNGDSFDFVPGQEGKEVDVVKSVYAINDFLQNSWDGSANEIELVTNTVQPRGSKEELSKIKDNLGGFSTDFSSSAAGRATNVKNACSLINGSVIYPGEQFSVYEAISPITTDNGYQIAGAYENGQVVDSVGGGVCQVATTLYNAVIRAELDIVQRYNHSMIVSYVKPSDDAAIAGTYKDLKFKNNLDNPVYIEGYCSGGVITFNVYGVETRPANREISFRSETISEEDPVTQFKFDAGQPVGYFNTEQSAHKGVTARLWKTVTVDGTVQSDEVFNNSKYKSSPKIVTVGTAGEHQRRLLRSFRRQQRLMMRARLNLLLRPRQQRLRHRQHRLRHRIRMRQGRHRVRRPRLQIRMQQGRHRAPRRRRQTRMQQGRHRAPRHSSRQDRRSKCPQVVVSDVVICNQCTGL